jgi:hypothetical protein
MMASVRHVIMDRSISLRRTPGIEATPKR